MSSITFALSRPWSGMAQFGRRLGQLFIAIELALQVRRERRKLQDLDERALKDLGLTRSDVHAEGDRTFWDVPTDRLRV